MRHHRSPAADRAPLILVLLTAANARLGRRRNSPKVAETPTTRSRQTAAKCDPCVGSSWDSSYVAPWAAAGVPKGPRVCRIGNGTLVALAAGNEAGGDRTGLRRHHRRQRRHGRVGPHGHRGGSRCRNCRRSGDRPPSRRPPTGSGRSHLFRRRRRRERRRGRLSAPRTPHRAGSSSAG